MPQRHCRADEPSTSHPPHAIAETRRALHKMTAERHSILLARTRFQFRLRRQFSHGPRLEGPHYSRSLPLVRLNKLLTDSASFASAGESALIADPELAFMCAAATGAEYVPCQMRSNRAPCARCLAAISRTKRLFLISPNVSAAVARRCGRAPRCGNGGCTMFCSADARGAGAPSQHTNPGQGKKRKQT